MIRPRYFSEFAEIEAGHADRFGSLERHYSLVAFNTIVDKLTDGNYLIGLGEVVSQIIGRKLRKGAEIRIPVRARTNVVVAVAGVLQHFLAAVTDSDRKALGRFQRNRKNQCGIAVFILVFLDKGERRPFLCFRVCGECRFFDS